MKKVILIEDIVTRESVYAGKMIEYHPSMGESIHVSYVDDLLYDHSVDRLERKLSNVYRFCEVNPLGGTDEMYIAMTDKAEKLLKFPFNELINSNKAMKVDINKMNSVISNLTSSLDYHQTNSDKYFGLKHSLWERIKFVFIGQVND